MTTVHFTNAYHTTSGGIRTFYAAMMAAAERRRWTMRLIVPSAEDRIEDVGPFTRIYHVRSPKAPFGDRRYRLILPHRYLIPGRGVQGILASERPDIVEVADKYSLPYVAGLLRKEWIRGAGRPTLIGLSCERFEDTVTLCLPVGEAGRSFARWYMRTIYAQPFDYHVANSSYTAEELLDVLPPHRRDVVRIASPGADIGRFTPARRSEQHRRAVCNMVGADVSDVLLVYAGRLSREKNLQLLVEMLATLPPDIGPVTLIVAGDGPLRGWLADECRRRTQHSVRCVGAVRDRDLLASVLANADAFVHPNPREPFGIAPLEAMASGLPVIAPRSGGILAYACDTTAWLVAPTGTSFAGAVRAVVSDQVDRRRRVELALNRAAAFAADRMADRHLDLYRDLHSLRVGLARDRARPFGAVRGALRAEFRCSGE